MAMAPQLSRVLSPLMDRPHGIVDASARFSKEHRAGLWLVWRRCKSAGWRSRGLSVGLGRLLFLATHGLLSERRCPPSVPITKKGGRTRRCKVRWSEALI